MLASSNGNDTYTEILSSVLADNTRIAYDQGWRLWRKYCAKTGACPLPATHEDVARFLVETAIRPGVNGKLPAVSTVILWRSAINRKHIDKNLTSPTNHPEVAGICKGLARIRGTQPRQVKALREHHIKAMLEQCTDTLLGLRDAAIIVLGYAAALRRSEICSVTVNDIEIVDDCEHLRMFLHIRKSKTDQEGRGHKIAIPEGKHLKPIARLQNWLHASGITDGPVFQTMSRGGNLRGSPMHHTDIPRIIKHYVERIGLNPSDFAGHSLRAGFVTSAAAHNARLDKIMAVTRHRNPSTVMRYIRDIDSFNQHAGAGFL